MTETIALIRPCSVQRTIKINRKTENTCLTFYETFPEFSFSGGGEEYRNGHNGKSKCLSAA